MNYTITNCNTRLRYRIYIQFKILKGYEPQYLFGSIASIFGSPLYPQDLEWLIIMFEHCGEWRLSIDASSMEGLDELIDRIIPAFETKYIEVLRVKRFDTLTDF